jgi:hypothetical protein
LIVSSETEVPRGREWPPALAALAAPDSGMERQALTGKMRLPFLVAFVSALLLAFAQAYRVDSHDATVKKMEQSGQIQSVSDKQFDDEVKNANRIYQVVRVAQGAAAAPVGLLLGSLGLIIVIWFARGKIRGSAVFPVVAAAMLPNAIADLLDAVSAFNHATLLPQGAVLAPRSVSALLAVFGHPIAEPWVKLGNAFDFFSLWGAVMLGFGAAAAGGLPARRALVFTLAGWLVWRLLTNVAGGS